MTGNKIADKITKISRRSQKKNLETVANENDNEIPEGRYISPEESQKTNADIRLIY